MCNVLTNEHVSVELGDYTWPNTHPKYYWCHQINGVRVYGHTSQQGPFCLRCFCW